MDSGFSFESRQEAQLDNGDTHSLAGTILLPITFATDQLMFASDVFGAATFVLCGDRRLDYIAIFED